MSVSRFFGVFCFFLVLTGCSVFQPKDDVAIVSDRSQSRMDALKAGNYEEAYSFMSPGYRSTNSLEHFKANNVRGVARLDSATVSGASCDSDSCTVKVQANYYYQGKDQILTGKPMLIERLNEERWIKADGKWWYLQMN